MAHTSREKTPRFAPLCASDSPIYPEKQRKIVPLCKSHPVDRKCCGHFVDSEGKLADTLKRAIKTYHHRPSHSPFRSFTHFAIAQEK
ncbi:hypothetical protein PMAYCL1PPCAC_24252 [Pristionchus mayeri]|uniref:Uncharacterized protein n=1 Tax=Pristionchus mayeri TaxID=1317129 RepID=A0AAN5I6A3_9BILA|nr:hypothetical protein PMAYCL1PPCAC_24252 [Pristionchus mayeri]